MAITPEYVAKLIFTCSQLRYFEQQWQAMTLAPDFASCVAQIKMLHKAKLAESFHELVMVKGFEILPVKVTIMQNGTAEEGFQKAKQNI